jgi:hypothetical protein
MALPALGRMVGQGSQGRLLTKADDLPLQVRDGAVAWPEPVRAAEDRGGDLNRRAWRSRRRADLHELR